jgi:hypothetical protein
MRQPTRESVIRIMALVLVISMGFLVPNCHISKTAEFAIRKFVSH